MVGLLGPGGIDAGEIQCSTTCLGELDKVSEELERMDKSQLTSLSDASKS